MFQLRSRALGPCSRPSFGFALWLLVRVLGPCSRSVFCFSLRPRVCALASLSRSLVRGRALASASRSGVASAYSFCVAAALSRSLSCPIGPLAPVRLLCLRLLIPSSFFARAFSVFSRPSKSKLARRCSAPGAASNFFSSRLCSARRGRLLLCSSGNSSSVSPLSFLRAGRKLTAAFSSLDF